MSRSFGATTYGIRGFTRSRSLQSRETIVKTPPQIRIHRLASLDQVDNLEWDDYLSRMSRANWSESPMNLGKMAMTYVESRELNDMLAQRYPDSYYRRKDIVDIQRGFGAAFRDFMADSLESQHFAEHATGSRPQHHNMWRPGSFAVRQSVRPYGAHALGVDLSLNPTLNAEWESIRGFLRHEEKLDLKYLRYKEKELHIKVLSTESDINLTPPDIPKRLLPPEIIALELPEVWREDGKR